jgi:hypothetical protein
MDIGFGAYPVVISWVQWYNAWANRHNSQTHFWANRHPSLTYFWQVGRYNRLWIFHIHCKPKRYRNHIRSVHIHKL